MSLKNLPLDAARLGVVLCVSVEAKKDPDTGEAKSDRDGVPVWSVGVAVRPEGRKVALIEVAVAGEPSGVAVGQNVCLNGLEAFWWEMNGRSGLAFRAESVTVAPAVVAAAPAEEARGSRGGAK